MFYYQNGQPKWDDYPRNHRSIFNDVVAEVITEAEDVTEPVSLAEVKDHARILGDDDDAYLTSLIKAARLVVEHYTGLSLVEKAIVLTVKDMKGGYELPYGPVVGSVVTTNSDDVVLTEDELTYSAGAYPQVQLHNLRAYYSGSITVEYTAGFAVVPADLKHAIKEEVAWRYEHRGDEGDSIISPLAKSYAKHYKRGSWLL